MRNPRSISPPRGYQSLRQSFNAAPCPTLEYRTVQPELIRSPTDLNAKYIRLTPSKPMLRDQETQVYEKDTSAAKVTAKPRSKSPEPPRTVQKSFESPEINIQLLDPVKDDNKGKESSSIEPILDRLADLFMDIANTELEVEEVRLALQKQFSLDS